MLQCFMSGEVYADMGVGEVFRGKLTGKYFAGQVHGGTFRRSWSLSCSGRKLSVRYSCAAQNAEFEQAQVDEILQNLEAIDAAAA